MRRVAPWAVSFAVLVGIATIIGFIHGRSIPIDPPDVVGVLIHPVPEGPTASAPIPQISDAIPNPLPHPAWQFGCAQGGDLDIDLSDGRTISYGPCRRPASINHLWAVIVDIATHGQCRPNCGPGGRPGP